MMPSKSNFFFCFVFVRGLGVYQCLDFTTSKIICKLFFIPIYKHEIIKQCKKRGSIKYHHQMGPIIVDHQNQSQSFNFISTFKKAFYPEYINSLKLNFTLIQSMNFFLLAFALVVGKDIVFRLIIELQQQLKGILATPR